MRIGALAILMAVTLAGCASGGAPTPDPPTADLSAQRGLALAQQRCAGCHDIGDGGPSRGAGPSFRDIQLRHNALSLERRLVVIGRDGHYEMPRLSLQASEIEQIAAYMETVTTP